MGEKIDSAKQSISDKLKDEKFAEDLSKKMNEVTNILFDGFKKAFGLAQKAVDELIKPMDALVGMGEDLAGISFSNFTSFSQQLQTISSQMKSMVADQINWQQELIRTYKDISNISQGSKEIYNMFVKTRKTISENLMDWRKLGGEAEGIKLAVGLASETISDIDQLSEKVLYNWRKQNLTLGLTEETSTKIMSNQLRSGMSVQKSLKFQKEIYAVLKNQFNNNALTTKMMDKIANSQWAILSYSKGNVKETARIAAHAHAWKVEIDEIYSMSQAMAEAEKAIEVSRKAQLMFGINLNARQMQYMAQMGQEVDLAEMLVDQFRSNAGQFDQLSLAQRKFIADTIAGGDVMKARTMLLGRETELSEQANDLAKEAKDPALQQLDITRETNKLMKDNTELLLASIDNLANYNTKLTMTRNELWNQWSSKLKFIFGEQLSAEEMSLKFEQTRVNFMAQALTPMLDSISNKLQNQYGIHKLIGDSITDESSLLGRMYVDVFQPIQEIVTNIGMRLLDWWFGENGSINGVNSFKSILQTLGSEEVIGGIVNAITYLGDIIVGMVDNLAKNPEIISQIVGWIANAVGLLGFFIKHLKSIIILWATIKGAAFGYKMALEYVLAIQNRQLVAMAQQAAAAAAAAAKNAATTATEVATTVPKAAASAASVPGIGWILAGLILGGGIAALIAWNTLGSTAEKGSKDDSEEQNYTKIVPTDVKSKTKNEEAMDKISPTDMSSTAPNYDYEPPQSSFEPTKISQDDQVNLATLIARKIKEELFVDMSQVKSVRNVIPVYTKS